MLPQDQLERLRERNVRLYVVATGAGAGIQQELWKVPGASAFLIGASFPYEAAQTDAFLGFRPERYASPETALDLAMEAFRRAIRSDVAQRPVGLALTAAVASTREHRGEHRVHVACVTPANIVVANLALPKGVGREPRLSDGRFSDQLGLQALLAAVGIEDAPGSELRDGAPEARRQFFRHPLFTNGHRAAADLAGAPPIFAGAFNPPHRAHHEIAAEVTRRYGRCIFAISANPPHKQALPVQQMLERSTLFGPDETVLFTENDPLYLDKARRFIGSPLVLGADAVLRMLDPKWGPEVTPMLAELQTLGTRFVVFGREIDGAFISADQAIARVPGVHRGIFSAMPGRWDISSTALRHQSGPPRSEGIAALSMTC
jgi:nicotinamide mononucleotide (NMN) deamidase PncC